MAVDKNGRTVRNKEYGKLPVRLLYSLCVRLIRFIFIRLFRVTWNVDPAIYQLDKPIIIVANHPSYLDPFLVACAIYPMQVNFLAADSFFRNPFTNWLLYHTGVIPKVQFRADPKAMKAMLRVIGRGGVLGIFPEGTRSINGRLMPIEETFTKFIKKIEANVVCAHSKGSYLTWPRWSLSGIRRGRIQIGVTVLATSHEIKTLEAADLHDKIISALSYDEDQMQKNDPFIYKTKAPAKGLHHILYQCPRCNELWTMMTTDNSLYCTVCGNTAIMGLYGFLKPADASCKVFETVTEWSNWEFEQLKPLAASPDFLLEDDADMLQSSADSDFVLGGSGVIRLTRDGFEFVPKSDEQLAVHFPISGIWGISSDYGVFFDLVGKDLTFRFMLKDGQKCLAFSYALDILRLNK